MPLLRRYRRAWFPLMAVLLALPLLGLVLAPAQQSVSQDEARPLAVAPAWPRRIGDWPRFVSQSEDYLRDHFGLRHTMIHAYALLVHDALRTGNALVFIGARSHLFLRGEDTIRQSAGLLVRRQAVVATADMLATIRTVLAARHIPLVVSFTPNAATIYPEDLPKWARNAGRPTEYDMLLAALAARQVPAIDLRPMLRAAKAQGSTYLRHDSHWSPRGALLAFNRIVAAAGLPDWRIAPAQALSPPWTVTGGDLARMLGLSRDVTDQVRMLTLPAGTERRLSEQYFPTYEEISAGPGSHVEAPLIVVIGDSFAGPFGPMVLAHHARFVWFWHRYCGFDWTLVVKLHPAQVWYVPTERQMLCHPGTYPTGLAADAATLAAVTSAAR